MYRVMLFLAIAVVSAFSYAASPDYLDYDSLTPQQRMVLGIYVIGASEAYGWANVTLVKRGEAPLFCTPTDMRLNGNKYLDIFKAEAQQHRSTYEHILDTSAAKSMDLVNIVLLEGLKSTFPCNK